MKTEAFNRARSITHRLKQIEGSLEDLRYVGGRWLVPLLTMCGADLLGKLADQADLPPHAERFRRECIDRLETERQVLRDEFDKL